MQRYLYSELDRSKRGPINQILFLKRVYKTSAVPVSFFFVIFTAFWHRDHFFELAS